MGKKSDQKSVSQSKQATKKQILPRKSGVQYKTSSKFEIQADAVMSTETEDERSQDKLRSPVRNLARKVRNEILSKEQSSTDPNQNSTEDNEVLDSSCQETGKSVGVTTRSRSRSAKRSLNNDLKAVEFVDKLRNIMEQGTKQDDQRKSKGKRKSQKRSNSVPPSFDGELPVPEFQDFLKGKESSLPIVSDKEGVLEVDTGEGKTHKQDKPKPRKRYRSPSSSSSSSSSSDSDSESDSERDRYRKRHRRSRHKKKHGHKKYRRTRSRSGSKRKRKGRKRKRESSDSESDTFQRKVQEAVKRQLELLNDKGEGEVSQQKENSDLDGNQFSQSKTPVHKVKSPSMSTVYTPAVNQINQPGSISPVRLMYNTNKGKEPRVDETQLARFLQQMRVQSITDKLKTAENYDEAVQQTTEKELAEQAVINAEKFKASLNMQPGTSQPKTIQDVDDEFFHITCHIDQPLLEKCQRGEFVELDKLLAKLKLDKPSREEKLDIVKKEGQSYLVTSQDKEVRISNVRKWDQAFRMYAAIYSKSNPSRAAEIWQYVHVIHTAAAAYKWENVAFYDMTFRHLMAANPQRSWAKIYTQGWSLAMRDSLTRNYESSGYSTSYSSNKNNDKGICWRFNKNKCKFGTNCRFDHRCSYCGGNHPAISCNKKADKAKKGGGETTKS